MNDRERLVRFACVGGLLAAAGWIFTHESDSTVDLHSRVAPAGGMAGAGGPLPSGGQLGADVAAANPARRALRGAEVLT